MKEYISYAYIIYLIFLLFINNKKIIDILVILSQTCSYNELAITELVNRGYSDDTIETWIAYIE